MRRRRGRRARSRTASLSRETLSRRTRSTWARCWSSSIGKTSAVGRLALDEPIHAHDDLLASLDAPGELVGGGVDLVLQVVRLDRGDRPAHVVDRLEVARARSSTSLVSDSTKYDPASGSTVSAMPDSKPTICWVRSARRAARSVGRPSASSKALVCRDCVPPSAAASAWTVTRTTLFSGCWAVRVDPPVWVWKRSTWTWRPWRRSARA